jgi:hypothetical protein
MRAAKRGEDDIHGVTIHEVTVGCRMAMQFEQQTHNLTDL